MMARDRPGVQSFPHSYSCSSSSSSSSSSLRTASPTCPFSRCPYWSLLASLLSSLLLLLVQQAEGMCEVPQHWRGGWFQSGVHEVISLTGSEFSTKGECVESVGEKFVFKSRKGNCFRCVAISEKHRNILQYKETLCEPNQEMDSLCSLFTGDAPLYSLFRRDAPPTPCALRGPLTFSYNTGHGECSYPASTIDSCTSDSRLLFKYQACPDVQGTESSTEEVECIGHWKEGSTRYFVGRRDSPRSMTDEDRYRCYAWEHARQDEKNLLDYRMAQSGDATCNGVFSAYDGSKRHQIHKVGNYSGCTLPKWVTDHRRWHALDHGATYSLAHNNSTLRLHHSSRDEPPALTLTQRKRKGKAADLSPRRPDDSSEMRIVCSRVNEVTLKKAVLVTHLTVGCWSGYVCTVLHRRSNHVIEMQQGMRAIRPADACLPTYFNESTAQHITLTSRSPSRRACPFTGVWAGGGGMSGNGGGGGSGPVTAEGGGSGGGGGGVRLGRSTRGSEGDCDTGVTHLRAGCGSQHTLEFIRPCSQERVVNTYVCHGHWSEGGVVFVVASPRGRPQHRLCLTAAAWTNTSLHVTGHAHSCPRHLVPPTTTLSVNLTAQGDCSIASGAASLMGRSSPHLKPSAMSSLLLPLVLFLLLPLLTKKHLCQGMTSSMLPRQTQSFTPSSSSSTCTRSNSTSSSTFAPPSPFSPVTLASLDRSSSSSSLSTSSSFHFSSSSSSSSSSTPSSNTSSSSSSVTQGKTSLVPR